MIVKDFELIGLCKVLDISYDDLKNTIIMKANSADFTRNSKIP